MLQHGISSYQIFSNNDYVFTLTTTYETLTSYEYSTNGKENEVNVTKTYKRVPYDAPEILKLRKMNSVQYKGYRESFRGKRYDVYALYAGKVSKGNKLKSQCVAGYRLTTKTGKSIQSVEDYYYIDSRYFEKK